MLSARERIRIKKTGHLFVKEAPLHVLAQYGIPEEYTFWEKKEIKDPGVWFGPGCIYAEIMFQVRVTGVLGYGFYVCPPNESQVKVNQGAISIIKNVPLNDWTIVSFEGQKQVEVDLPPDSELEVIPLGEILDAETLELKNVNFVVTENKLIASSSIYGRVKLKWHTTADLYIWKPDKGEADEVKRAPKGGSHAPDMTGEAVEPMQVEVTYAWYPCFVIKHADNDRLKTLMPEQEICYTYPDLMQYLNLMVKFQTRKVVIRCREIGTGALVKNAKVYINDQLIGTTDEDGLLEVGELELYKLHNLKIEHPYLENTDDDDLANSGLLLGMAEDESS